MYAMSEILKYEMERPDLNLIKKDRKYHIFGFCITTSINMPH